MQHYGFVLLFIFNVCRNDFSSFPWQWQVLDKNLNTDRFMICVKPLARKIYID